MQMTWFFRFHLGMFSSVCKVHYQLQSVHSVRHLTSKNPLAWYLTLSLDVGLFANRSHSLNYQEIFISLLSLKVKLFIAYSLCFYDISLGSHYSYSMQHLNKFRSCYHKCLKVLFGYPKYRSVTSQVFLKFCF